jgi:hypothetical protein
MSKLEQVVTIREQCRFEVWLKPAAEPGATDAESKMKSRYPSNNLPLPLE